MYFIFCVFLLTYLPRETHLMCSWYPSTFRRQPWHEVWVAGLRYNRGTRRTSHGRRQRLFSLLFPVRHLQRTEWTLPPFLDSSTLPSLVRQLHCYDFTPVFWSSFLASATATIFHDFRNLFHPYQRFTSESEFRNRFYEFPTHDKGSYVLAAFSYWSRNF